MHWPGVAQLCDERMPDEAPGTAVLLLDFVDEVLVVSVVRVRSREARAAAAWRAAAASAAAWRAAAALAAAAAASRAVLTWMSSMTFGAVLAPRWAATCCAAGA